MKGGRDEEKQLDPLFPRIHINDAEKGGPRPPPRNKMALCQHLTLPCNRLTSGSISMLPLPPSTTTTTTTTTTASRAPSASSSHVGFQKESKFSRFCSSPGSYDLAVRPRPHASSGVKLNSAMTNPESRSLAPTGYLPLSDSGHMAATTENNLFQPHNFLNNRISTAEKTTEQGFSRFPSFAHLGNALTDGSSSENMEKFEHTSSCRSSSGNLCADSEKQPKATVCKDPKAKEYIGKQAEANCKVTDSGENHDTRVGSPPSTEKKTVTDMASYPLARDGNAEPETGVLHVKYMRKHGEGISEVSCASVNRTKRPASVQPAEERTFADVAETIVVGDRNVEPGPGAIVSTSLKGSSLLDVLSRLRDPCAESHQDLKTLRERDANRDSIVGIHETISRKRSASTMENSINRPGDEHRRPHRHASANDSSKYQDCIAVRVGIIDRSDGTSDTSVVDSIAGLVVSPDDVAGIIGQKQFWKARRTILQQQRIFEVQIFELHRLIKVQRLIAESPEMLFDDNFFSGKSSIKFSPSKKLIIENIREPSSLSLQVKPDPRKRSLSPEGTAENGYRKQLPLHDDIPKGINTECPSTPKPHSQALTLPLTTTDVKFEPLFFHPPPGNQWLIPVRSPSEGLIYKPYTGPCPPPASLLAPVYGSCGPISLTGGAGSLLNPAYCVSSPNQVIGNYSSHTPFGQACLQPYGMPVINPSTVEKVSTFAKPQPTQQANSIPISDPIIPYHNSCNIPSQKHWIVSECVKHLQGCKDNDLQGCTANNPPERKNNRDALSLFPTTPSLHVSSQPVCSPRSEQPIQVIKVVPYSRKSATESAARIFRTIQEERKQHE